MQWLRQSWGARPREPGLEICRPFPRPPRKFKEGGGGKSMENLWKIHGQIQGFWKPRFRQKVKVWKKVGRFRKVLKVCENLYNVVALTFLCGSRRGSPGIDFSKGSGVLDLRQYWENNKRNIEKITNTNKVSDVLWDQMSPKKGGIHPRIIPHPSHLPESHFY